MSSLKINLENIGILYVYVPGNYSLLNKIGRVFYYRGQNGVSSNRIIHREVTDETDECVGRPSGLLLIFTHSGAGGVNSGVADAPMD